MEPIVYLEINKDDKLLKFLRENSYYYKYLNRHPNYLQELKNLVRVYNRKRKVNKVNSVLDSVNTVSFIVDNLK